MRDHKLLLHVEPADREPLLAGDLVELAEVDLVDVRGAWNHDLAQFVLDLRGRRDLPEVFAYLQVFTLPLPEWQEVDPHMAMGELPAVPALRAWAYGREAIDWPRVAVDDLVRTLLSAFVEAEIGRVGLMLDNFESELEPWMFGLGTWANSGMGPVKRRAWSRHIRSFAALLLGHPSIPGLILNGRGAEVLTEVAEASPYRMVERSAARRREAELRVASGERLILSCPAEETWNLPWLLNLWTSKPDLGLSFTADDPAGLQAGASILAYERAIAHRKAVDGA